MSKRDKIIVMAKNRGLAFVAGQMRASGRILNEMCLATSPFEVYQEFNLGISTAKKDCTCCLILEYCMLKVGGTDMKPGISNLKTQRDSKPNGTSLLEIGSLANEMNFTLNSPDLEVAKHYNAEGRTVVRWRRVIRAAL